MEDNNIPTAQPVLEEKEYPLDVNRLENLALIQTHLQISNIVNILFTIDFDVLNTAVENSPVNLQQSTHFNVLKATRDYYKTLKESYSLNESTNG